MEIKTNLSTSCPGKVQVRQHLPSHRHHGSSFILSDTPRWRSRGRAAGRRQTQGRVLSVTTNHPLTSLGAGSTPSEWNIPVLESTETLSWTGGNSPSFHNCKWNKATFLEDVVKNRYLASFMQDDWKKTSGLLQTWSISLLWLLTFEFTVFQFNRKKCILLTLTCFTKRACWWLVSGTLKPWEQVRCHLFPSCCSVREDPRSCRFCCAAPCPFLRGHWQTVSLTKTLCLIWCGSAKTLQRRRYQHSWDLPQWHCPTLCPGDFTICNRSWAETTGATWTQIKPRSLTPFLKTVS